MRRYVIIGDGAAGTAAVETLRQEDAHAAITLLSADPNPCYYRAALTNYLIGELRDGEIWAVPPDFYDRYRIERHHCRAARIEPDARLVIGEDGRRFPYDALLIASGARARAVRVPGDQVAGVRLFRTLQDVNLILHELPLLKQAVVAGGGILGLEWVHGLHLRGVHPIFMMRGDIFWPHVLDRTASDIVLSRMRRDGVDIRLGEEVAEILSRDGKRISAVRTKRGEELACQLYGMAFGIEPNIEFLEGSGVAYDRRGIKVDPSMQSNIPTIFAAGDVVDYQDPTLPFPNSGGLWKPSREQAQIAARNMLGMQERYQPGALYNATRLWDLDLGSLGVTHPRPEEGYEEIIHFPEPLIYKKLVVKENRVHGALLLGDRREGRAIKRLMDRQLDISTIKDRIFDEGFDLKGWIRQQEGMAVDRPQVGSATVIVPAPAESMTQSRARALSAVLPSPSVVGMRHGPTRATQAATLRVRGQEYALTAEGTTIGRAPDNSIVVAEPSVSGRHASITLQGDRFFIADLRSTNGTFVDGERLDAPRALLGGEELRFGDVVARFEGPTVPDLSPSAPTETVHTGWFISSTHTYALDAPLICIGRSAENEVPLLQDVESSRLHAQVTRQSADGALYLLDMGSANGTHVNGERMSTPRRLRDGDEIRIGRTTLRFVTKLPAGAPPLYDPLQLPQDEPPFILVAEGPNQGQREPLKGSIRVGRSPESQLVLADPRVSRFHAEIIWQEGRVLVRDLGSANGTWIGTTRLWGQTALPLPVGAELRLGSTVLRLEFGGEAVRAGEQKLVGGETIIMGVGQTVALKPLWLTFREAGGQPPVLLGDEPLVLGRDASCCNIILTDGQASRQHVQVERRPDGVYVSDMGSANGTFINDVRIGSTLLPLRPGDVMRIGKTTIRLTDVPPAYTAPPATPAPEGESQAAGQSFWLTPIEEGSAPLPLEAAPLLLGRDADCDIVLADLQASRQHARLEWQGERYTITDLGSSNGTFVNGGRLEPNRPYPLASGDGIRIGQQAYRLEKRSESAVARVEEAEPVSPLPPPAPPEPAPLWLLLLDGERAAVPLGDEPLVIGRHPSSSLVLSDVQASRLHAEVARAGELVTVRDLGSANGSYLNDRPISQEPVPMRPGEVLRIGTTRLQLTDQPPGTEEESLPPTLRLTFAPESGLPPRLLAEGSLLLGREESCDIVLRDPQASRRHARVERQNGGLLVTDLGSSNGTFLNEERLAPGQSRTLTPQDKLRIGQIVIRVEGA